MWAVSAHPRSILKEIVALRNAWRQKDDADDSRCDNCAEAFELFGVAWWPARRPFVSMFPKSSMTMVPTDGGGRSLESEFSKCR